GTVSRPASRGMIGTREENWEMAATKASRETCTAAMKMLDARVGKTEYVAGPSSSYGDIPVGIMCYRCVQLVPQRPPMANLDRWYGAISKRKAFQDYVASIPLT